MASVRSAPPQTTTGPPAKRTLAKTLALRVVLDRYETVSKDCAFVDVSIPDRVLARPVLK